MTTLTKQTLGSDSTLKQFGNENTELHLNASDIGFFSELIDEDLERCGDLYDDEAVDFILETQNVFDSAIENVIHDEELITVSLTEEQKDYFFYDLLQGILYEGTANHYLEDDMSECWEAMENCWNQMHPDQEKIQAERKEAADKEVARLENLAKSYGFKHYLEWQDYDYAIGRGDIKETSKYSSIKEYRIWKKAQLEAQFGNSAEFIRNDWLKKVYSHLFK